jgi:hypothetical protein
VVAGREGDEFVLTASIPSGGSDRADPHIDQDDLIDGQTSGRGSLADADSHD